jgi:hypothetical protein
MYIQKDFLNVKLHLNLLLQKSNEAGATLYLSFNQFRQILIAAISSEKCRMRRQGAS